jgi:hypothetical protein
MKDGAVSVEFIYNKAKDEISLNMDAAYEMLGQLGAAFSGMFGKETSSQQVSNEIKKLVPDVPVWGKEGTFDPNNPYPITTKQKLVKPTWIQEPPKNAESNKEYQISWKSVPNAKEYRVYITQNGKVLFDSYPTNSSIKIIMPNATGTVYIGVIAIPTSYDLYEQSDELQATVSISLFSKEDAETCALYSALAYQETRISGKDGVVELYQSLTGHIPTSQETNNVIFNIFLSNYRILKEKYKIVYFSGKREDGYVKYGDDTPYVLKAQLEYDGYTGITYRNYNDTIKDNISYTLAYKKINDTGIQLAVILRGTDTYEWYGNMDIGNSERHESFEQANKGLQSAIKQYISNNGLKNIHFLITGHSRGAAVGNLLATDLNEGRVSENKSVVAYLFATPNCTKIFKKYDNIFNFCFEDDFVPQVPLEKWGYTKNGHTFTAVAEDLKKSKPTFYTSVEKYISLSADRKPQLIGASKVAQVKVDVYTICPTINDYNNTEKLVADLESDGLIFWTLHKFMKEIIAGVKLGNINKLYFAFGNFGEFQKIKTFFLDGAGGMVFWHHYIDDTHNVLTYYHAIKEDGFLIK